jgi:FkbM family methyltransferase
VLFRDILPHATVLAFEANPFNFRHMQEDQRLNERDIRIFPLAVSECKGTARFHITDVDYSNPQENRGTSSLLTSETLKIKQVIDVETCRLDEFLRTNFAAASRIGLWIDVEGAEFSVLKGIEGVREKVVALHVETAREPFRPGQKPYPEVAALLRQNGLVPIGTNMKAKDTWGDVVFIAERLLREHRGRILLSQAKALAGYWLAADRIAVSLKERFPPAYHWLRKLYLRIAT